MFSLSNVIPKTGNELTTMPQGIKFHKDHNGNTDASVITKVSYNFCMISL